MKKSKLSLGLVTGFVASLALAGCGSVSNKDNSILTYTSYDGETKYEIVTEKMYDNYRKDNSVISTYYDKVLEVLIRDRFASGKAIENATKDYETIKALAEEDVKASKAQATENSKTNGTSYDAEWESILNSEGVEDENELLEKYIYNQEKTVLEDALYASLTTKTDDQLKREWIEGAHPYHIRHILGKVDTGATDYTRGTITAEQAIRLSDIGMALGLSNDTFGGVAQRLSEDEGSAKLYGDVGLVTDKASTSGSFSMVTEFQLAIYIYDAIYQARSGETYNDLVPEGAAAKFNRIAKVPYQVFELLASEANGGYGDVTTRNNRVVGEGEETVYPRNILWNKYLNHHEPFLITDETVADVVDGVAHASNTAADAIAVLTAADADYTKVDVDGVGASAAVKAAVDGKTGFRDSTIPGVAGKILTDEKGNPIFGVRSEYGIHFIIIEKSAFETTENLMNWYQVYSPKQAEYPTDESGNKITSYVNYSGFDDSTMTSRASAVKDAVKGFDGSYQYRLFTALYDNAVADGRFNFDVNTEDGKKAKELIDEINSYISLQKEKYAYDQEVGYDLAWDNFMLKFDEQEAERSEDFRVVPFGCAIGFNKTVEYNDDIKNLYKVGGLCYYGSKAQ